MGTSEQKQQLQAEFRQKGYAIQEQFLSAEQSLHLLEIITQFKQTHTLPEIYREVRGRSLRYRVIDGELIAQHLPEITQVYKEVKEVACEVAQEDLAPLGNLKVGANVNITPKGGVYRWHYDRNAVTVLIYLNQVRGGELELYPSYRIFLKNKGPAFLQRWLDNLLQVGMLRSLFTHKVVVQPLQGRLVIMRGNRCLHSVRPVEEDKERVNMVLSYDTPLAKFRGEKQLDAYLYTQEQVAASDQNYAEPAAS